MSKDIVRVLLVEDSPSDARLLCESLEDYPQQRFGVERAERLDEALVLLARTPFDVVLLDLNLPDSRGMETCARMSRAAGQVPVLILTGADDETIAAQAMRLGIQDYLVKSQAYGSVIGRTIRYAVERGQAQEALHQANARLQDQAEELQSQAEELRTQAEELRVQTEELAGVNATLRESEGRYRSLFENMLDGYAYCRMLFDAQARPADFIYLNINEAFTRLTGLKDVIGKKVTEVIPEIRRSHPELLEIYGRVAATGLPERFEMEFKPLGIWLWVSVYSSHPGYFTAVFDNITERKRAEAERQQLNEKLEQRVARRTAELLQRTRQLQKLTLELSETEDRERQRMAEILHDDLQQVLAAAKFHVSLMRNRVKYDAALQATATQIDQMLKDAIEKSRNLSHELSPAVMHHGDLAETLRWLANQVRTKYGLVVHAHTQGQMYLQSEALQGFFYKAAQELLFNVVKHAGAKEARLRARHCRRYICLSISDRGRGFDPQELRDATGFGLLNIRERVELLGGRMRIRSVRGQGSRFLIVVPDTPGERKAGSKEDAGAGDLLSPSDLLAFSPSAPVGLQRLRVLLVDDHKIVRQGLVSLLHEEDAVEVVGEATNGREAVDLADRLHPDVVIMDMSMPVMSGDEATRQIKNRSPQVRIVALSMYEDAEVREKMCQAGADSYVLKTAPAEELVAAIRGPRGQPPEEARSA
ncbi:MAG: response regulator [Planctomycetes bacterium]|nr:response regulator [Planctomycetota bacterium]